MRINPAHFYCSGKELCTPVRILDVPGFKDWQKKADIKEVAQAKTFGFQGFDTQLAYIHNEKGELTEVLFGTNLQRLPANMRSLAIRLPEGAFEFPLDLPGPVANVVAYFWALGQYNFSE